ncbi:MAG TPA: HEAT repeat domain-containing protein [Aggregatilineales bacterium]|nr:HEAT repeat domain-containing protein [Aggregatilineales bacterium]
MFGGRRRQPGPVVRMLQSPDPAVRMRAVNILGGRRRPRAAWLLQRVYRNDPNPQIREQARQYLTQWAQNMLNQLNSAPQPAGIGQKSWECDFCGTKDVKGGACPNCGAPRPDEDD